MEITQPKAQADKQYNSQVGGVNGNTRLNAATVKLHSKLQLAINGLPR